MYRYKYAPGKRWAAAWTHQYTEITGLIRRWFGGTPGGVPAGVTPIDAATRARSAAELAAALCENSNLELDRLWYATNMTSTAQRRVCLQRALQINPHSEDAKTCARHPGGGRTGLTGASVALAGDVAVVYTSADAIACSSV